MNSRLKLSGLLVVSGIVLSACIASAPKKDGTQVKLPEPSRCLSVAEVTKWVQLYNAKTALPNPPKLINKQDAQCTRKLFQEQLATQADLVGYKVALTNPEIQRNFEITEPIWGAYYANMLKSTKGKISIDTKYGVHPIYEAGLVVRVKSAAINKASTPQEVLRHIDQIIPFVELADVAVQKPSKLTAYGFMAINTGIRTGILGRPLKVSKSRVRQKRILRQLQAMSVRVIDGKGNLLGYGKGKDNMGHPLQSVLWLVQKLKAQGLELKPNQLVSLGSFSPMMRPKAGQTITVAYLGLTGARSLVVNFK